MIMLAPKLENCPFHWKLIEILLTLKVDFPLAQYILLPLQHVNYDYFNNKDLQSAPLETKECLKFERLNTNETREEIVAQTVRLLN